MRLVKVIYLIIKLLVLNDETIFLHYYLHISFSLKNTTYHYQPIISLYFCV